MFNKILVALALLVTLLTMVACSPVNAQKTDDQNPVNNEISINTDQFAQTAHIQKQMAVAKGEQIVITLASNASTGLSWNETAVIGDASLIQQLGHETIASDSNLMGASGNEQWTLKAMKAGTTTVHFEYGRLWEGGEKAVWTLDLTVTIKSGVLGTTFGVITVVNH